MQPGDRLICAFIEPLAIGYEFKGWPLHVTVVPWFRTGADTNELASEISAELAHIKPFEAVAGPAEQFGYQKSKTANIINQPTPFVEIEKQVRQVLIAKNTWMVDETTRQKRSYKPHVTVQKSARLNKGDKFQVERVYIVEQKGGYKTVESEVRFG